AAHRFDERAGMQVALLYALGGTDYHRENLIAAGERPVVIVLETVLRHEEKSIDGVAHGRSADASVKQDYWNSVLCTALLPYWDIGADGTAFDISGLGSVGSD